MLLTQEKTYKQFGNIMNYSLIIGIFLILPFLPVFLFYGAYQESDLAITGLWCAGGLSIIYHGIKKQINLSPTAILWLAMAALSVLGIFQNYLCSVTGVNEIREGTLTFLCIAFCITFIKGKINNEKFPFWIFPLLYGFLTVFGFYGWKDLGYKTYNFLDVYGFAMLASLPMYTHFRNHLNNNKNAWDGLFISCFAFLLYYCDNKALNLACLIGLFFVFIWPIIKNKVPILQKKTDGFYVAAGLLLTAILVLLSWFFFDKLPLQLQSRTMLAIVTVLQFFNKFDLKEFFHLIFGYGWGSYQQFPVLNIFQIDHFAVYANADYKPNWEFLERNLLHSHNIIIESFISSGLIGVAVLIYGIYKATNYINAKDLTGKFYWLTFFLLYSAWFQMPTTIHFSILAMALIKEDYSINIKLPKVTTSIFGFLIIVFSCWDFYSSCQNSSRPHNAIKNLHKENSEFLNSYYHKYDQINFGKCSNNVIGANTETLAGFKVEKDSKYLPEIEKSVIEITQDFLNSKQTNNIVSFVHVINLCNALANLKDNKIRLSENFENNFKNLVLELLKKFPERADMAMGYLSWKFQVLQDFEAANYMADEVLKAYHNHPIGLAIKSLVGLSKGIDKIANIEMLKTAIKGGLNKYMPVPPEMLKTLGIE